MEQWVTSRSAMQEHVASCGRHVHYCDCCLSNMFGMPAVEAFLRICLYTIKVLPFVHNFAGRVRSLLPHL